MDTLNSVQATVRELSRYLSIYTMFTREQKDLLILFKRPGALLKTLYLFGKSDIPVALLPTVNSILPLLCHSTHEMVDRHSNCALRETECVCFFGRADMVSIASAYLPGRCMKLSKHATAHTCTGQESS